MVGLVGGMPDIEATGMDPRSFIGVGHVIIHRHMDIVGMGEEATVREVCQVLDIEVAVFVQESSGFFNSNTEYCSHCAHLLCRTLFACL